MFKLCTTQNVLFKFNLSSILFTDTHYIIIAKTGRLILSNQINIIQNNIKQALLKHSSVTLQHTRVYNLNLSVTKNGTVKNK